MMNLADVIQLEKAMLSRVDPVSDTEVHNLVFRHLIALEDLRRARANRSSSSNTTFGGW